MEKRGSRYLRYALFNAAKYVCLWCPTFSAYLEKKRSEGKHYNVAISHAAKKLVRLIFAMQRSGKAFLADYYACAFIRSEYPTTDALVCYTNFHHLKISLENFGLGLDF